MKIVYTPGVWDILHPGHLNVLKRAKLCGDHLVVGVCSDRLVNLHKQTAPTFNEHERTQLIAALEFVNEVFIYDEADQTYALKQFNVDVFVVGEQFGSQGVLEHQNALDFCIENNIPIVRIPRLAGISSSDLKSKITQTEKSVFIKDFWKTRGQKTKTGVLGAWQATSLTLTEDAAVARREKDLKYILEAINRSSIHGTILELGCGTGRITLELAKHYQQVHAVDYVNEFLDAAKESTKGYDNIIYTCADCQDFNKSVNYDCCLISGLLLHLNDEQLISLVEAVSVIPCIVLKESIGTFGRYELADGHYSEQLQSSYVASYRSLSEIIDLFASHGFLLKYSEVVDQHRKETHLQVFLFEKPCANS